MSREPRGAKAKKAGVGVDEHASEEEGSADDDALPGTAASEAGLPVLLHEPRPSLEQYREKWAWSLALHSKPVEGGFSNDNLVPLAIHVLWQDCPYVAFSELKSEEAQARLSVCKPISGLQESCRVGGVERYAHNAGDVSRGHRYKSVQCVGVPRLSYAHVRACGSLQDSTESRRSLNVRIANCNRKSLGQFPDSLTLATRQYSGIRSRQAERPISRAEAERAGGVARDLGLGSGAR